MLQLRDEDLEWREIDEEVVVLDGRAATYLAVSGSGILIWRLLAHGAEREALVGALVETYGIETAQATHDVDEFLGLLDEHGLLSERRALLA